MFASWWRLNLQWTKILVLQTLEWSADFMPTLNNFFCISLQIFDARQYFIEEFTLLWINISLTHLNWYETNLCSHLRYLLIQIAQVYGWSIQRNLSQIERRTNLSKQFHTRNPYRQLVSVFVFYYCRRDITKTEYPASAGKITLVLVQEN